MVEKYGERQRQMARQLRNKPEDTRVVSDQELFALAGIPVTRARPNGN